MAVTPKATYNGRDLMLFIGNKSVAYATNHTLSQSVETQTISTKDHGIWGSAEASTITWEITSENLYTEEYDTLFSTMVGGSPITVKFGLKKDEGDDLPAEGDIANWVPDTTVGSVYYEGSALITSLELQAQNGEKASFSATFQGVGKLEQKTVAQA